MSSADDREDNASATSDEEFAREVYELLRALSPEKMRVVTHLTRLYQWRQLAPHPAVDAEIMRVETAIQRCEGLPAVPPTQ